MSEHRTSPSGSVPPAAVSPAAKDGSGVPATAFSSLTLAGGGDPVPGAFSKAEAIRKQAATARKILDQGLLPVTAEFVAHTAGTMAALLAAETGDAAVNPFGPAETILYRAAAKAIQGNVVTSPRWAPSLEGWMPRPGATHAHHTIRERDDD